uniref:maturase K n=1 Tax=Sphaeropteris lepifera TaxID=29636 RepID=UPI002027ACDF|nr:maturase K [Cyathea lepifera]QKV46536.1 maturase K [Cyathea lepifera]UQJ73733.1 maturase K [Cyathea lepifera]
MRTVYGSLPRFGTLRKSKKITLNQECFLYPFFFKDDFYSIACKRFSDGPSIDSVFGAYSMISAKRLIDRMRHQDYSEIIYSESGRIQSGSWTTDSYFYALLKTICLVLEIPLLSRIIPLVMKTNSDWRPSQSIHSIFLFLEDRLPNSNHVLDTKIPLNLHIETPIRMFRRRIQDAPFLHLSRLVLHKYRNLSVKSWKGNDKNFDILLWNFYIYEIESLLLFLWKQLYRSQLRYSVSTDQNNITRKERLYRYGPQFDTASVNSYLTRSSCIHYGRYKNHSLIAFGGTRYFAIKWIYSILILVESHCHYRTESNQMCIKLLSNSCVSLLGYILCVQSLTKKVRVGATEGSHITLSSAKNLLSKVPISLLVKLMAKENFRDSTGRPVSKLAWTTSTDDAILNRFVQTWRIFSLYHSGSINRDGLRRLRYILRFSCDNTLACKHKSATRSLRRRFDSEIVLDNYLKNYEMSPASSTLNVLNNQRVWHLNITRPVLSTLGALEI